MKIIQNSKCSGKTTEAVKFCIENNYTLVVQNKMRKEYIIRVICSHLKLKPPNIKTIDEIRLDKIMSSSTNKIFIDDLDEYLYQHLGRNVVGFSLNIIDFTLNGKDDL